MHRAKFPFDGEMFDFSTNGVAVHSFYLLSLLTAKWREEKSKLQCVPRNSSPLRSSTQNSNWNRENQTTQNEISNKRCSFEFSSRQFIMIRAAIWTDFPLKSISVDFQSNHQCWIFKSVNTRNEQNKIFWFFICVKHLGIKWYAKCN